MSPSRFRSFGASAAALPAVLLAACADRDPLPADPGAAGVASGPVFVDCTHRAGIDFQHFNGAEGKFQYPETLGGGGGFLDADGDGLLDLFLVNGGSLPPRTDDPTHRLYRNRGDGTFEDVTAAAGLAVQHHGMAPLAADLDNDGDRDLLVTGVERNLLFLNRGDGTFEDASARSGLPEGRWSSAATFLDHDRDGILDLVLGHYVRWSPAIEAAIHPEKNCVNPSGRRDYCPVRAYPPEEVLLFQGRGDGTFRDVSAAAGFGGERSRVLGLAVLDCDGNGWLDVFVANDTEPSQLFLNQGDGTFVDLGYESGLALNQWGNSYAGMGVDVTFEDGGRTHAVAVGNFSGEPVTFHRGSPPAAGTLPDFREQSAAVGLGAATLRQVTFGLLFLDYDRDGAEDLFLANGHLGEMQEYEGIPYRQPCQVFHRDGPRFQEATLPLDSPLAQPVVGRGLAAGDADGDGDVDLLVLENGGRARLLENRTEGAGHWLRVQLRGTRSNRDGLGSLVTVAAPGVRGRDRVTVGTSYLSLNETTLTFGLGAAAAAAEVEVLWPSGVRDVYRDVPAGTTLQAVEGETGSGSSEWAPPSSVESRYGELSLAELEARADQHTGDLPFLKMLGDRALQAGRGPLAEESARRAVELAPLDSAAALLLLRVLEAAGREADVRSEIAGLFDRLGADTMTLHVYYHLIDSKEHSLSRKVLEEALRRAPDSALLHYQLGALCFDQDAFDEAAGEFATAARLDPGNARMPVAKAHADLKRERPAEAESAAREALEREPGNVEAHVLLARALHLQGRTREGVVPIEERLREHPAEAELRRRLIQILQGFGQTPLANQHIALLVRHNPEFCEGWELWLRRWIDAGDFARARTEAGRALEHCSESAQVLYLAALAESEGGGDLARAAAWADEARRLDPTDPEVARLAERLRPPEATPDGGPRR